MIQSTDFPALQRAAGQLSSRSQKRYFRLFGTNLAVLVAAPTFGFLAAWTHGSVQKVLLISNAASLFVGVALSLVMKVFGYEKTWFHARAAAESIKSQAWRYMTAASPYVGSGADQEFLAYIGGLPRRAGIASGELAGQPQITKGMRELRDSYLHTRLAAYLKDRLEEQINWYRSRAEGSRRAGERMTLLAIVAQVVALACAVAVALHYRELPMNLIGMFTSAASSVLAWTQVKRYQELAHVYSSTADELGLTREGYGAAETEAGLSELVDRAETTMTREHDLWLVRRTT